MAVGRDREAQAVARMERSGMWGTDFELFVNDHGSEIAKTSGVAPDNWDRVRWPANCKMFMSFAAARHCQRAHSCLLILYPNGNGT
jgi:hypothetical protein